MRPSLDFLIKLCILSLFLWWVIFSLLPPIGVDYKSIFIAWVMATANAVAGYLIFEYAFDKTSQVFTIAVFGGLAARLLILMTLVFVIIFRHLVAVDDFVFSFFAFYCIYLIVEILGYQKKNKQKKNIT
ncbi:MAG: hypothetical protein WCK32_07610 [Chlorobiaceae bacterium]